MNINTDSPLFTDLYQLTMLRSYLDANIAHQEAVFELFFRDCPFGGEYAVVAGYDRVRQFLENFKFKDSDIEFLKSLPAFEDAPPSFFKDLEKMHLKDICVLGLEEGELVFPRVPILQLRGPLFKVQLLETALLNAVNFASLAATYARRLRVAAPNKKLVEFGMRRAQGPNGAMTASRSSFLGGFDGSSNVAASASFGIPSIGTMAHSYVQSFWQLRDEDTVWKNGENFHSELERISKDDGFETNEGELAAFINYAKTYPDSSLLLIDTYDSLRSGLPNAIRVFKLLKKFGHKPLGIRLDSGDLVHLSREARRSLDAEGFTEASIFASNELSEEVIASLETQGAKIDGYGVGTHLATCKEQPALGGVYKLVELNSKPRLKISQQTEKIILPGAKQVYRFFDENDQMLLDYLCEASEDSISANQEFMAVHPFDDFKRARVKPARVEKLLKPLFENGSWAPSLSEAEIRESSLKKMIALREDIQRRKNPTPYKVSLSPQLKKSFEELYKKEAPVAEIN